MKGRAGLVIGCVVAFALLGCDDGSAPGESSIAGTFDGRAFDQVGASYRIGAPDDPEQTTVIYVFDAAVECAEISDVAWDEAVAAQTQSLEMKLIGTTPGQYSVALGPTPSNGEASVNYTLTSTSGNPSEVTASGGSVTLDTVDPDAGASGSFMITFPSGDQLTGTFSATQCAAGKEP